MACISSLPAGDAGAVRRGALDATAGAGGAQLEGLRGHRHDAEGRLRLPQEQVRGPVSGRGLAVTWVCGPPCRGRCVQS